MNLELAKSVCMRLGRAVAPAQVDTAFVDAERVPSRSRWLRGIERGARIRKEREERDGSKMLVRNHCQTCDSTRERSQERGVASTRTESDAEAVG